MQDLRSRKSQPPKWLVISNGLVLTLAEWKVIFVNLIVQLEPDKKWQVVMSVYERRL